MNMNLMSEHLAKRAKQLIALSAVVLLQACGGGDEPDQPDPSAEGLGAQGEYSLCTYSNNLRDSGYASARVSYPCELSGETLPATTLTGGWTNTKEDMYWLADHLTSHGYIVFAMTPTNIYAQPDTWQKAHVAGFNKLASEHARAASPIYGLVDLDKRNIMGFSMGGGGTLLAAAQLQNQQATAIALAPWLGDLENNVAFENIQKPTFVLGSENDNLAYPQDVTRYYNRLPAEQTKLLAMFAGASHGDWYLGGSADQKTRFKTIVTAVLETYLKSDFEAEAYLNGDKHQDHVNENWYSQYQYLPQ